MKQHSIKLVIFYTALLMTVLTVFSCVTTVDGNEPKAKNAGSSTPVYYGRGRGDTSITAMQAAKKEALIQAAADLLGAAAAKGQKAELDLLFAGINDFDPYVFPDRTIDSSSDNGFYYYLGVRVNLSILADKLKSADILGGQIDGRTGNNYSLPDQAPPAVGTGGTVDSSAVEISKLSAENSQKEPEEQAVSIIEATAEELEIISRYIGSLTYMVYYNEEIAADPFLSRTAVTAANRYLEENGYEYIDLSRIELIKKEQELVYEEETGSAVSIIQWIAHKLNADIYIELSLDVNSSSEGSKYYGSAAVNLNCYSASTAEGRGSAVYKTIPPAFSRVSEKDALNNAVSSAVFNGMAEAVAAAEKQTVKAVSKGFKYILTLYNTEDSRLMLDFEKKLSSRVKDIKRISYSPEECVFEVYLLGEVSELEDIVYDTVETDKAFDGFMLIMQRGNSLTFDTGL